MATMTVSLPDPMKEWIETQVLTGEYASVSDYVRDLVRRDRARRGQEFSVDELRQIVAEQRDVEGADRDVRLGDAGDDRSEPLGERHSPGRDAEEHEPFSASVRLEDLMGDARQSARDVGFVQHCACSHRPLPFSASLDGSLKDVELPGSLAGVAEPAVSDTNRRG